MKATNLLMLNKVHSKCAYDGQNKNKVANYVPKTYHFLQTNAIALFFFAFLRFACELSIAQNDLTPYNQTNFIGEQQQHSTEKAFNQTDGKDNFVKTLRESVSIGGFSLEIWTVVLIVICLVYIAQIYINFSLVSTKTKHLTLKPFIYFRKF